MHWPGQAGLTRDSPCCSSGKDVIKTDPVGDPQRRNHLPVTLSAESAKTFLALLFSCNQSSKRPRLNSFISQVHKSQHSTVRPRGKSLAPQGTLESPAPSVSAASPNQEA